MYDMNRTAWTDMAWCKRAMMLLLFVHLALAAGFAQSDNTRGFTTSNPLIYEDVWDLWPYSFLNDNGDPDGFNVDLVRLIMEELDIPYVIRLKPSAEAYRDLKEGKSDLMLGLAVGFHDEFGKFSKNAVTLFTQSVVMPKDKEVVIKRFRDLSNHQVIVCDSSLAHHLMLEYGWGDNAIAVSDMSEAIQEVSAKEEGQILWNTLSLKWLMQRYHTDNLEIYPVNMQHGQYKFMSNNQQLLDLLDEAYTKLYTNDKIQPLQDKWFYPERQNTEEPKGLLYLLGGGLVLFAFMAVYGISYRIQERKIRHENVKRNNRLALILQTSQVHIWTYNIKTNQFSWHNDNGQVAYTYSMEEFSQRYSHEDFVSLKSALDKLADTRKTDKEEKEIELNLRAKDVEGGDTNDRDYHIVLSVLSRDKKGRPAVIIGTKKDVTEEQRQKRLDEERTLRYWSIFYTPILGIMLFDRDGRLVNVNPKACDMFGWNAEEAIEKGADIRSVFDIDMEDLEAADGYQATHAAGHDKIAEYRLMTIHDDAGERLGVFAFCRDITLAVSNSNWEEENQKTMKALSDEQRRYTEMLRDISEKDWTIAINRQPQNFAGMFEQQCVEGWRRFMNGDTHYIVENPYEQLTVDIDGENLGHAIEQVTCNAAQHTKHGTVRARYDYIGRQLVIAVDDTGEGIDEDELAIIRGQQGNAHSSKRMGLVIARELVSQMGGTFEISSEVGAGTTVYIIVPCNATDIKRKRTI